MSHDELPPNAEPERPAPADASDAAREASPEAALPAPPARRRRKTSSDPDSAAPESPASAEKPARAPRSRRKAAPNAEPPAETTQAETPAPAETVTAAADAPASDAAPTEEPSARPPRRRAPRARKAAAEPTAEAPAPENFPPPDSAAVSAEGAVAADAPASDAAPTEEPSARPTRRRAPRARKAPAEPTAEATAPAAPPTAEETAAETAPQDAETAKPERPARRRRGGRSRRAAEETAAESTPEVLPAPEIAAEAGGAAPALDAEDEGEAAADAPPSRSRRRRERRGRGRDAETPETAAAPKAVSARALPEEALLEEREERIDRTVGAHLVWRQGVPEIHINGVVYPPILFFGNVEGERNRQRVVSEARRAARAGVHLHSTLVELVCPLSESHESLDEIDARLNAILDADPEGFVMPRIVFVPARGWKRQYPTEISTYANGETGDPSIASERFWQEAEQSLVTLIEHLRRHEWGKRIFGYHLERGEWFQPADLGYDRSIANREAFRDWLREKYRNNLVGLRAAWHDGDVQFHTADIPPQPDKPNPKFAFYDVRRERRFIDFNEFTSESAARRLIALARVIKKAANGQALVSVCYGYTFEFGHPFSGHLALTLVQSAQAINLICGPPSYRDRRPGGAASLPAPVDSPPLHGKLWLSEDDTKTYLAPAQQDPDDFNPRMGDRFATEQAQARAMGRAMAHATGIGWMDLWGEGWLDEDGIWERLEGFTARYAAFIRHHERRQSPEVVAIIDERSLLHIQRGEAFFRRLTNGLRDVLQRAGVSYGTYLQSDLLNRNFPTDAKLYLFLTPFRLNAGQRAAIKDKLQQGGKTLAWLYAPGSCEEYPGMAGAMEEWAFDAVGITLRQQEWNSEIGSRIVEPYHPITERMSGREIGPRERLNPSFYVDDSEATTLAEYQGSGLPSLAAKNLRGWRSVFIGDPVLPLELLRGLCRFAGVHQWLAQGEDSVSIGNGWITIHASRDGSRTLRLPAKTGVYDVTEQRLVADSAAEYRFSLRMGMTRTFCVGPVERFLRLGLPNVTLPGEERAPIILEAAPESRKESLTPSARADLETLEAVLSLKMEDLNLPGEDEDLDEAEAGSEEADGPDDSTPVASEAGEVVTNGRRRRRRGGRGRWRKRPDGQAAGAEGGSAPEPRPGSEE